jgi:hypothetical protein
VQILLGLGDYLALDLPLDPPHHLARNLPSAVAIAVQRTARGL